MKHYFFSCKIGSERINGETTNLVGTLEKLIRWANSGFQISNLTFKSI